MSKPVLCLDFDGVLHSYASGWQGVGAVSDAPVPGAVEFLLRAQRAFTVAVYSSRSSSVRGRWAMQRWLRHHLREYYWTHPTLHDPASFIQSDVNEDAEDWATGVLLNISWPWSKPAAFITLDDRAVQFTGEWPNVAELQAFKPWNK